jgi:Holliday junction resolvase RusA-like endonuclease
MSQTYQQSGKWLLCEDGTRLLRVRKPLAESAASESREGAKTQSASRKRKKTASLAPVRARFVERTANPGEKVFVLPLPPKKLSPNGREHWRYKAQAVKAYRGSCAEWFQSQMHGIKRSDLPGFQNRVVIDLEFYLCRLKGDESLYYPKDEDNARSAMKAAQDALKDAGIIPGDGKRLVKVGSTTLYTRAKEHRGFTCVVMTLRSED